MSGPFSAFLYAILEVVWRRRALLILPIALIVPLGLVYAKFGPKIYVAKTLLLLQESDGDSPLSRNAEGGGYMRDQAPALEALLKSDRVMRGIMADITGIEAPTEPRQIERWIRDFSSSVSLSLVGNNFLELQLTSDSPVGLGRDLEAVTARFLDALMLSRDALGAAEVVLSQRKKEYELAERALAEFRDDFVNRVTPAYKESIARIGTLRQQLVEKERELAVIAAERDKMRESAPAQLPQPSAELTALESRHAALKSEIESLGQSLQNAQHTIDESVPLQRQLRLMEMKAESTRESYQSYTKRYTSTPTADRGPGLLKAPERIQLIDPPRDPEIPKNSSFKVAAMAVIGAMMASLGLAFAAEFLDTRVRRAEQVEALTGVPVLARLPRDNHEHLPPSAAAGAIQMASRATGGGGAPPAKGWTPASADTPRKQSSHST